MACWCETGIFQCIKRKEYAAVDMDDQWYTTVSAAECPAGRAVCVNRNVLALSGTSVDVARAAIAAILGNQSPQFILVGDGRSIVKLALTPSRWA